jgi:hypothetical protein
MQKLFETPGKRNLLGAGLSMVASNKRYIVWFWLLNLVLAIAGTSAFRESSHTILDHSLYSERLTDGLHLGALIDLLVRPEFGPLVTVTTPAVWLACLFFLATALFLPGVFAGYASNYRLPREDFFHACGRNLWRFIRLMIVAGIVMGIVAGLLFAANGAIATKAEESTMEVLPFTLRMIGLFIIFLIMTTLRIWFDLAEADIVLNDQTAVRKSTAAGLRHTFQSLGRLLGSYVLATILAAVILVGGLLCWIHFVPSISVTRAFLLIQLIMLLLLVPRFWQRGIAVSYWQQHMLIPVVEVHPVEPSAIPLTPALQPIEPSPTPPIEPPETPGNT